MTYEFCRCVYDSEEWAGLRKEGWRTLHVNEEGVALMRRRRSA
jgi:hypothetical protein